MSEAMLAPAARARDSHIWARHPDDWYVEPCWVSERLFEEEHFDAPIWDPSCGLGRIVKAARAAGLNAYGSDKVNRSEYCQTVGDFLQRQNETNACIVSNPPFGIAQAYAQHALEISAVVCLLLPTKWIQGDARSRWLETTPLAKVLFITPRPSMPPGPVIEAGVAPGGGKEDFAWFIWRREHVWTPRFAWLRRAK